MPYIQKVKIGTSQIREIINRVQIFLDKKNNSCFHIANLNPEIFMLASKDSQFRNIINSADELLIDGIGISVLSILSGTQVGEKLAGTDLMSLLIEICEQNRKKVLFLGGSKDTAKKTALFFQKEYPSLKVSYSSGTINIKKETKNDKSQVFSVIKQFKPDFIFIAYGPPWQEKWIYKNREHLQGVVCMGVGGSFNFFSGEVMRAPKIARLLYLEWLWRFIFEPKRMRNKIKIYMNFIIVLIKKIVNLT